MAWPEGLFQDPGSLGYNGSVMALGRLPQLMHHVVVQIQVKPFLRTFLHEWIMSFG
jgi:hypothetical protein